VIELPRHARPGGGYVRTCLLDVPDLFARDGIYGDAHGTFGDNDLRFATLSRGALEVSARVFGEPGRGEGPDILHAHDWHAALAVLYARTVMGDAWSRTPSVFTLHNLAFQGLYGHDAVERLGLPPGVYHPEIGEQLGAFNLVKAATALATRVTTVSPNHAREILTVEGGFGLDAHLRAHAGKITGIVNGIDEARFDPGLDPDLVRRYDLGSFVDGRAACKAAFTEELGISSDGPLFGMVSRLTWQKGVDLFLDVLEALVDRGASAAIVGRGEPELEAAIEAAASNHPGRVASRITFDGALARRLYSASDFLMVPSRFEPCGLTQLYGMRYGALPVVTRVGGLVDTVLPMDTANGVGTGFLADRAETRDVLVACDDALVLYGDATGRHAAVDRAMSRDSSWTASARAYLDLFRSLRG
jgi:starch synthase